MPEPIVKDGVAASKLEFGAAIVLDPLREFLDAEGLGKGALRAVEIGGGHSNLTFLLGRDEASLVLRRPPRGELASSTNDVLRESRILAALETTDVPVPDVLARCEDPALIGAPFFIMSYVTGATISDELPTALDTPAAPMLAARETASALSALHEVDTASSGLAEFGRPSGYLERQLRRFGSLLEANATRSLRDLEVVAEWLVENLPRSGRTTFVHGDFRLGNLLFDSSLKVAAVLDWEMATMGDPLADLGYLTAMWTEPHDRENPMFSLSRLTRRADFPRRAELVHLYEEASREAVTGLGWYQVLALWKAAIFLEGSYRRFKCGASSDSYFESLEAGVPAIARTAREWAERIE